jgi:PTH1 family peptidyl-tRNA hydrolase
MKSLWSFQNAALNDYLIIGLGNPGCSYEKTRHNVGFRAVRHFAERHRMGMRREERMMAEIGRGKIGDAKVGLILPLTYMNSSGEAVRASMKVFKVPLSQLVVVVDDVALPLGTLRLRAEGSHGGHNGLKSVESHVESDKYPRLRMGVGSSTKSSLADYVLGKFEPAEESLLPEIFERTADVLDCWLKEGIQAAMTKANRKEL